MPRYRRYCDCHAMKCIHGSRWPRDDIRTRWTPGAHLFAIVVSSQRWSHWSFYSAHTLVLDEHPADQLSHVRIIGMTVLYSLTVTSVFEVPFFTCMYTNEEAYRSWPPSGQGGVSTTIPTFQPTSVWRFPPAKLPSTKKTSFLIHDRHYQVRLRATHLALVPISKLSSGGLETKYLDVPTSWLWAAAPKTWRRTAHARDNEKRT